jgi:hypothetical protein
MAPGCSSWFPNVLGAEVDDARDSSCRHYFAVLLYLTAKPTHMMVDVDGLACPLQRPMACDRQTMGQGLLLGVSCLVVAVGWWHLSGGMRSPRAWIFGGVLTMWIPVLLNLTWSKSSFTGGTLILCQSHHGA